jgi:hypothetical protein
LTKSYGGIAGCRSGVAKHRASLERHVADCLRSLSISQCFDVPDQITHYINLIDIGVTDFNISKSLFDHDH